MISIYTLLLYIHILSAVLSIGPLFVVLTIVKKMRTASHVEMSPYIEAFKGAITIVKHSGHVLVASGILLMWHAGYHWSTSWIVLTFLVMLASIVFLARAFKPTLQTFNTPAYDQQKFTSLLHRKAWMYILLLLIMLWLMVAKPVLW
ncbi:MULTISPECIES: hypothetical protein [Lysinibacillus]|uniref:DUF2269 domain-containing protein n=1 Tax=Lysinibacillus xylanilyticus TaxID=582475 RepID=A0A2M9PXW0_9BACI|nr:hypothetical protein [Lysinibacillus xylanilyticus]PJO40646.1 hypothetical protein CWD94_26895 [Lysinibacillus xylanilyticus]QPQ32703.1 hypothetical protein JNUCC51_09820 [Lysinibacillus sp. JNUCC-51]